MIPSPALRAWASISLTVITTHESRGSYRLPGPTTPARHNAYFLLGQMQHASPRTVDVQHATISDWPYLGSICFSSMRHSHRLYHFTSTLVLSPCFTAFYYFATAVMADGDPPALFPLCIMTVST